MTVPPAAEVIEDIASKLPWGTKDDGACAKWLLDALSAAGYVVVHPQDEEFENARLRTERDCWIAEASGPPGPGPGADTMSTLDELRAASGWCNVPNCPDARCALIEALESALQEAQAENERLEALLAEIAAIGALDEIDDLVRLDWITRDLWDRMQQLQDQEPTP